MSAVSLALLFGQSLPIAFAEENRDGERPDSRSAVGDNFCTRFTNASDSVTKELSKRVGEHEKRLTDKDSSIIKKEQETDTHLGEVRIKEDKARTAEFAKIDALAKTDAQKVAVTAFKVAVTTAISIRRTAVDAALTTFRAGVEKTKTTRRTSMEAIAKTFKASVETALTKAKTSCAAGTDPKTVKATLTSELKTAQTKLQADRKALDGSAAIKNLVATKKKAIESAMNVFHASMETARGALKLALGSAVPRVKKEND
jgi:hypothetical protein